MLLALGDGSRRYHELLGDLEPISEKVLTQTLRAMERDGLIGRQVHAEVPPRVDYALTPLGATLAAPMRALGTWSLAHGAARRGRPRAVRHARAATAVAAARGRLRRGGAGAGYGGIEGARTAAAPTVDGHPGGLSTA